MKTLGILGAGQLGRMLAQAAQPLGVHCKFYSLGNAEACEGLGEIISGDLQDKATRQAFLSGCDAVTYEWENIPAALASSLAQECELAPGVSALKVSQDRLDEKNFFRGLGLHTADFLAIDTENDLFQIDSTIGYPCILKTRRFGYDGKGQAKVTNEQEAVAAFAHLGGQNIIAEQFIPFERELSVVAVANKTETLCYPLVENVHAEGILRTSIAPAPNCSKELQEAAQTIAEKTACALEYQGVFAIELFQTPSGLRINEMAPRVHNSGHWTMDGCEVSQFENHVRAVLGLGLGSTTAHSHTTMLNIIGRVPALTNDTGITVHLYNKAPRPGRKLGHINITAPSEEALVERVTSVKTLLQQ